MYGCSQEYPGQFKRGSVLRDDHGMLVWAIANYYGVNSNMKAEMNVML